jgi:glycerate kinase
VTTAPRRVLIAPDKFKGTLSALEAADATARGWRRGDPSATLQVVPVADGGEGTMDALVAALDGSAIAHRATGPLGEPVDAAFGLVHATDGLLGVVEMARASGLALVPQDRRDPTRTTTRGTGELILAACRRGAERVLVCVGGSATNDAGAGMAQALGFRLLDADGANVGSGGGELLRLDRIDATGVDPAIRTVRFEAAVDVDNPLTGPAGASAVYGPQKGAGPADVDLLDRALARFALVVRRDLGMDVDGVPGAGAAGGMGAGLIAFLGARLRPGVDVVIDAIGLEDRIRAADLVVTGEGSFDAQSLRGKAPAGVLRAAARAGVPAVVLCGRAEVRPPGVQVHTLVERCGERDAMERARSCLEELAARVAADRREDG